MFIDNNINELIEYMTCFLYPQNQYLYHQCRRVRHFFIESSSRLR